MADLTNRQQTILEIIQDLYLADEPPPTIRELVEATGSSSTSVVNNALDVLERLGFIERRRESSRGIKLVQQAGRGEHGSGKLTEAVRLHQVQIADLQAEVQRLGRIVEGLG